jgi:O-antigen/teichoic acid export membrane protein
MLSLFKPTQLKKNFFSGTFTAAIGIVISIVSYPLYLFFLGTELYGLWALFSVFISFSSIGNLGVDDALIKYVAEEYALKNLKNIQLYITTGINMLICNGILLFIIFMVLELTIRKSLHLTSNFFNLFHLLYPFVIILSIATFIVNFINSALKGIGRFDQANYILLIGRIIALAVSLIFFICKAKIWSLFWGQTISIIFIGGISIVLSVNKIGFFYKPYKIKKEYLIKLIKFGGTMTVAKLVSLLLEPFMKIVITRYTGLTNVTYFDIANRIILQIRSLFERGINAIMPEISRLSSLPHNAKRELLAIMNKVIKGNAFVSTLVFGSLFIISGLLLKIWLSGNYHNSILFTFLIVGFGYWVNLLIVPMYYFFMGLGEIKYCFYNHIIQSVINFLLTILAIYFHSAGYQLVVIIYSFSLIVSSLILFILYHRYIKVNLSS